MKSKILFFVLLLLASSIVNAQNVGIGTDNPDAKAILDIESNSKGLLTPRVTTAQRSTISSSGTMPNGLLVFDVDVDGFFFWNESLNAGAGDWEALGVADAAWFEQPGTTVPNDINDLIYTNGVIAVGASSSPSSAQITLGGTSALEGGEIQLNGGSSHTSNAYALDNYEGRLRFMETTNANGSANVGTTNEFMSFKRTSGTSQMGIGLIGGNAWPSESNLIVGNNGTAEGGQIQLYSGTNHTTSWFLDVFGDDFRFLTGNNITGSSGLAAAINSSGNYSPSDIRIKNVIGRTDSKLSLDLINRIKITDYQLKDDESNTTYKKVIAQELKEVYPNAVYVTNGKIDGKDVDDYHLVDYDAVSMLNVSATQELYKLVQQQQELIEELQFELEQLKK